MTWRQFSGSFAFYFAFVFCCFNILFFPVPYYLFPDPGSFFEPVISPLVAWAGIHLLGIESTFTSELLSDSTGLYIFVFLLGIFSCVVAIFLAFIGKREIPPRLSLWFYTVLSYYLSLTLLKYGADKIFKSQFYLPEPNTLFTPLGSLTPDMLFWSAMGSSYTYTVFSGIIEVIPALLLLFRKTRLAGILISVAVMINVVMINLGFDITVKVYSLFLLFISLVLLAPHLGSLYRFFIAGKPAVQSTPDLEIPSVSALTGYSLVKTLVIGLMLVEACGIYFATGNLNDDKAPRPPLHGAYDVYLFTDNDTIIPASMSHPGRFKRIFFHRKSYFIVQTMSDHFIDYKVLIDELGKTLTLYDSGWPPHHDRETKLAYRAEGDELVIFGYFFDSYITLSSKKIELDSLPLFREKFHWTIDGF